MKTLRRSSGFSLIEVMVVLLIIGIMAAMIAPNVIGSGEEAKRQKAAVDIQTLKGALQMYKLRNNRYPTTEQGLESLVSAPTIEPIPRNYPEGGYIDRLPEDPWGNPYALISPGELGEIDIFSNGPDGEPGTDDDIGNWNIDEYL
ncbi:type II secretion system major pseudopilin GspG [Alteromonas sp. McT4-15]|jgi:general secretion pathway protein G|uniref:type II secretion system major pseudopilin GspG n=1 Tax=unclassified Alteromonas TaxID=2614992 RepID=UPI00192078E2|nr:MULTISPECIES: type II secretion system major pseudopilin GspG [unclassified Alteromonas]MEC8230062.1 type II secretion system major pseudopilin GspG [Pseudomonadota bacterium]MCB4434686.1 type II secretion system major pseudopilin GspG [Alteromonas sp. McT4-15]WDT86030.1 type II secretion system major pseudopilin GspG [Alteromonas sp. 009811495]BCO20974.1 type II secretion system protein GspG [Alteromonas sp. KC3]BCO24944.1 type II secretion system protein GspG [Alteromonas sp. KC14]